MRLPIFQIDAFANRLLAGNPAAVIPLPAFPDAALMQAIAAENNLSETAFLVPAGPDDQLRWFTPMVEVPLCGHGTLASAAVVMQRLQPERRSVFQASRRGGEILCRLLGDRVELEGGCVFYLEGEIELELQT